MKTRQLGRDTLHAHARNHSDFLLGIDARWTEPFSQGRFETKHPFLDLPNVHGSPHNSGIVPSAPRHAPRQPVENIRRYLRGEDLTGLVRREDYL